MHGAVTNHVQGQSVRYRIAEYEKTLAEVVTGQMSVWVGLLPSDVRCAQTNPRNRIQSQSLIDLIVSFPPLVGM